MLQLSQINIFPVKSLDGYSPKSAIVTKRGLQYDRRWMITEPDGKFMTQRTYNKMALLQAIIENNSLVIKEKQNEDNCIKVPFNIEGSSSFDVVVWDDTVQAILAQNEINEWLSDFLGKKCQLVTMPESTQRRVDEDYNRGEDIVSFADGYPFLIIGEASMHDLNDKIQANPKNVNQNSTHFEPLSIRRFRTNFVYSGGTPYQEDEFTNFKIGGVDFVGVKNCARCVLTTLDPDTGTKGKEPLATLSKYRLKGNKVLFGQNAVWNHQTWQNTLQPEVKVGDIIQLEAELFK
ncbi:MOSC domain-containing protein [Chondrinema litorale]|uniref:MOSC domain-containing protein n=1 Tax=Chondrinema litorale TaxID=2994555 RepID=UPI0025434BF2|nr:MOSC N-terminal beta barrel domain-containing protein [Chondrinema litorale]UZR96401.1 MOSC N-terminal beta barrel domain-containing protein [Chondrinema litorale]